MKVNGSDSKYYGQWYLNYVPKNSSYMFHTAAFPDIVLGEKCSAATKKVCKPVELSKLIRNQGDREHTSIKQLEDTWMRLGLERQRCVWEAFQGQLQR